MRMGVQSPALLSVPKTAVRTFGQRAVDLSAAAGRTVLPWQQLVLNDVMAVREDGLWAASEVGILASRQNGKTGAVESMEMDWMISEPGIRILHTAHRQDTANKTLTKLYTLMKGLPGANVIPGRKNPFIAAVKTAHSEAGIHLHNGSYVDFSTRTDAGGRGTSYDRLVVDEAMYYKPSHQAAIEPLVNTGTNPQIIYMGSAPDVDTMEYCQLWADLYYRALEGDPALAYFGWMCPPDANDNDPEMWAMSNPSMGHLFTEETIASARKRFRSNVAKFRIEYMSIGNWPKPDVRQTVIDMEQWASMGEYEPKVRGSIALGLDMTADRKWATISAATWTDPQDDDPKRIRLEVLLHEAPSRNIAASIKKMVDAFDPVAVVINRSSPAFSVDGDLKALGIEATLMTASQMMAACGGFYDDALNKMLSHAEDPRLTEALEGVDKKTMSGGWGWDYSSDVIVSPLTSATAARWGLIEFGSIEQPPGLAPSFESSSAGGSDELDLMSAAF